MLYELNNLKGAYRFNANSYQLAVLVTICLGAGSYSARSVDGVSPDVPLFLFTDSTSWFEGHFNKPFESSVKEHAEEIVEALESLFASSPEDASHENNLVSYAQSLCERIGRIIPVAA